jgi:hypothetical protein
MATPFLWSDVDSFLGPIGFQPEELAGLTVRGRDEWEEEEDWEDDDDGEENQSWDDEDEEDNDWDDEEDEGDDWGS